MQWSANVCFGPLLDNIEACVVLTRQNVAKICKVALFMHNYGNPQHLALIGSGRNNELSEVTGIALWHVCHEDTP